jgi:hypothetical protein
MSFSLGSHETISGFQRERKQRNPFLATKTWLTCKWFAAALMCTLASVASVWAGGGALEIRQGYFWDPIKQEIFIPRGIAYQLWNPPVGANQSFEQLHYDLVEIKKMYANSVRCELVWGRSR